MIDVQSDSRKIKPGDTFVALRGILSDGHDYVLTAIKNGAKEVVVEEGSYSVNTKVVSDTRKYLSEYLKEKYNDIISNMNIIGITGTNGKTTTAMLIHDALNKLGQKTAYIGTIGFYIGSKVMNLPNTTVDICDTYDLLITAYEAGCKNVIMEISSHALSIGRIETLNFNYAIFTNLTQDHLDYHKTMGNYALVKQQLFKKLLPNGKAIINNDDKYKEYFLLEDNKNITYGFNDADFTVTNLETTSIGSKFTYKFNNQLYSVKTSLLGDYNVYNILGMIALLSNLRIEQEKIIEVIPELNAPVGRMEKVEYKGNTIIIDYAHTPDALENVIPTAKRFTEGNVYVVFGCTGERDREKRPIMTEIVGKYSKYFIITNDDPHYEEPSQIVDDMVSKTELKNFEICLDRKEAIHKGIDMLKENDTLLILGKGHEEVMIIKKDRIHFNDKEVVLEYLEELN